MTPDQHLSQITGCVIQHLSQQTGCVLLLLALASGFYKESQKKREVRIRASALALSQLVTRCVMLWFRLPCVCAPLDRGGPQSIEGRAASRGASDPSFGAGPPLDSLLIF